MIDLAQLREALEWFDDLDGEYTDVLKAAAKERLAQMEAGALIITPDEDGAWPEWALVPTYFIAPNGEFQPSIVPLKATAYLDALRDAMPDGET